MAGLSYEAQKKLVIKGLILLGIVTVIEVFVSLVGKGHVIPLQNGSVTFRAVFLITALLIVGLSLYKAYYIIFEFMHMKYEAPGLVRSVLVPTGLLIWAIIAFLMEGNYWKEARAKSYVQQVEMSQSIEGSVRSIKPLGAPAAIGNDPQEASLEDQMHDEGAHEDH